MVVTVGASGVQPRTRINLSQVEQGEGVDDPFECGQPTGVIVPLGLLPSLALFPFADDIYEVMSKVVPSEVPCGN